MNQRIKLKCVDPTQTLTKGGVYVSRRTIKESGMHSKHFVSWNEATHILVKNDHEEIIRTLAKRFELADEQEESKASAQG